VKFHSNCIQEDILRGWGQEYPRVKKLDDLMPINVTVTNSGKIALPEIIKKYYFH